jgi:hypothetical protein
MVVGFITALDWVCFNRFDWNSHPSERLNLLYYYANMLYYYIHTRRYDYDHLYRLESRLHNSSY